MLLPDDGVPHGGAARLRAGHSGAGGKCARSSANAVGGRGGCGIHVSFLSSDRKLVLLLQRQFRARMRCIDAAHSVRTLAATVTVLIASKLYYQAHAALSNKLAYTYGVVYSQIG